MALLLSACTTTQTSKNPLELDWLLVNGTVFDGSDKARQDADIGVAGNKIVFIGDADQASLSVKNEIDAEGLIVAPGFIDPHTHLVEDLSSKDRKRRANLPYLFQGVTTTVIGNDGFGHYEIDDFTNRFRQHGIGTNTALFVGFGPVRRAVLGDEDRPADAVALEKMRNLVRKGMCEGGLGFSAGLYYAPQNFADTEEVVALASVAGELGGIYESHIRDESSYNIGIRAALDEALEIGRRANAPVHIAHIKALGPAVWGASKDMIAAINNARTNGQKITADQYPWEASGTRISNALVPRWALDGGLSGLRVRLADPEQRQRVRSDMLEGLKRRGGAEKLLFTGSLGEADLPKGVTLADYAKQIGQTPLDAAIMILEKGDSRVASFVMADSDINAFATVPWVVTGSDGSTGHPRKYASFPQAYQRFVKRDKLFDMARFIRRSSGQTADLLGLDRRGYIREGYFADIVIFDPKKFAPRADYENPTELSVGVIHLFINGQMAISDGVATHVLAGRPLLKDSRKYASICMRGDD